MKYIKLFEYYDNTPLFVAIKSNHIYDDIKRGWSSWNFGQEGFRGSYDELENYLSKATDDNPIWLSGFEFYKDDINRLDIRELYHNYWVLVDNENARNGISGIELKSIILEDAIKEACNRTDYFGDGISFSPEEYDLVFSEDDIHVFKYKDINEKLTLVDNDVDMLYNLYFKKDIDIIRETRVVTKDMFKHKETDTSILKDKDSVYADKYNRCKIDINNKYNYSNFYKPDSSLISLSINNNALNYCIEEWNGNIDDAANSLFDNRTKNMFRKEFTEEKIKGSIHHELAHWIDDSINNKHLSKKLETTTKLKTKDIKGVPFNSTFIEIQGQIHNIKQLYNKYKDIWDMLSLTDVFKQIPSLSVVYNELSKNPIVLKKWIKNLVVRMNREGLLGKNMKNLDIDLYN